MTESAPAIDELSDRLNAIPASARLRLVPVRHHSPACARHLETLIRRDRPEIILIEGPADATPLISYLADGDAVPPLALYFYHCEKPTDWLNAATADDSPTRHRGFYPLAAFSPEWVAIREGAGLNAQVQFIDLPYAHRAGSDDQNGGRDGCENTLLDDRDLANANPTARMIELSDCRDFNEWWDRYYESGGLLLDPEDYFRNVLSWCLMLREAHPDELSDNDAREVFMATQVRDAIATGKRVMVITGGFHTEAIANLLDNDSLAAVPKKPQGEQGLYIVPYTLGRLDAANDYAAGIANSSYYQEVWQQHTQGDAHPHQAAAEKIALRVSRSLQDRGELVSMPDCMEAVALSRRLGALRGVAPGRAEILDAMQTAFIKDMHPVDVADQIGQSLRFELKGQVPKRYPAAPLVEDFRNQCRYFKLVLGPIETQEKRLDIYRSERHRQISRLLHRIDSLQVPYAEMTAGPDFAAGQQLQRVREIWQLNWTPETEALLTERMAYGGQLEEAALNFLLEQLDQQPREAPRLLIAALRMGLHSVLDHVLSRVNAWLQNEGRFPALVDGLKLLALAHSSQNALAAHQLSVLQPMLAACFERACLRLTWLGQTDEEDALIYMSALGDLNALAQKSLDGTTEGWADVPLFIRCVEGLHGSSVPAPLRGRAAAILTTRKTWSDTQSKEALRDAFNEALANPQYLGGYMLGFLPVARAFLIQSPDLLDTINQIVSQWSEEVFLDVLPNLRLAFTALKPRETIALGKILGHRLGGAGSDEPNRQWSPDDLKELEQLHCDVATALSKWGMTDEL